MTIKLQYDDALMISILLIVTLLFFIYYQIFNSILVDILPCILVCIITLVKNIRFLYLYNIKNKDVINVLKNDNLVIFSLMIKIFFD